MDSQRPDDPAPRPEGGHEQPNADRAPNQSRTVESLQRHIRGEPLPPADELFHMMEFVAQLTTRLATSPRGPNLETEWQFVRCFLQAMAEFRAAVFQWIETQLGPEMRRLAPRYLDPKTGMTADDCAQDVILAILGDPRLQDIRNIRTYVLAAVRNTALGFGRRAAANPVVAMPPPSAGGQEVVVPKGGLTTVVRNLAENEDRELLEGMKQVLTRAVTELNPLPRAVVLLNQLVREQWRMPLTEVGTVLGIEADAVKTLLIEAQETLLKALNYKP